MKFSLKKLFLFVTACAFIVWFVHVAYRGFTHVEKGENVSSVGWLPRSASNVSFYKSYSFTAYEFDISESEFVKWSRWQLSPITEPVSIFRYSYFDIVSPPQPNAEDDDWEAFERACGSRWVNIRNGLYCRHFQLNGGGVCVIYDRNKGRAYYHSLPR